MPYEGAATGSGGEIRDEGAVGRGSRSKAGLSGYGTSNLMIPGLPLPWEVQNVGYPNHVASSLDIMLHAPLGSAAFNNEFGRPCVLGYFRTLLTMTLIENGIEECRGYHKPIMLAGGIGTGRRIPNTLSSLLWSECRISRDILGVFTLDYLKIQTPVERIH